MGETAAHAEPEAAVVFVFAVAVVAAVVMALVVYAVVGHDAEGNVARYGGILVIARGIQKVVLANYEHEQGPLEVSVEWLLCIALLDEKSLKDVEIVVHY